MVKERTIICPKCESRVLESYYAEHRKSTCAQSIKKRLKPKQTASKPQQKKKAEFGHVVEVRRQFEELVAAYKANGSKESLSAIVEFSNQGKLHRKLASELLKESHQRKSKKKKKRVKKEKGIVLYSKRGMKLPGRHACTNCTKTVDNPTRYAESNKGVVILCAACKSRIRAHSFPKDKQDALDYAHTGGRFEGDRRKH